MENSDSQNSNQPPSPPDADTDSGSSRPASGSPGSSDSSASNSTTDTPQIGKFEFVCLLFNPFWRSGRLLNYYSLEEEEEEEEYMTLTDAWTDPAVRIVISGAGLVAAIELTGMLVVLSPYSVPGTSHLIFAAYPFIGLLGVLLFLRPIAALWAASVVRVAQRGIHYLCFRTVVSWFGKGGDQ